MSLTTELIHSIPVDEATGAISVPIYQTTTFVHSSPGVHQGYDYTRSGNPTRKVLEDLIAKAEKGATGIAFASGMAAVDAVLKLLKAGDHVIAGNDIYGGTYRLLTTIFKNFGITTTFVDLQNEQEILLAIKPNTRLVWVETPTNPSLKIVDIRKVAAITKAHHILLCVDNTFATPVAQRPIELGADLVVHSATKYIGGHSDVISGLVVTATRELGEQVLFVQNASGAVLSPIESWLLIRGLETLELRFKQHSYNAQRIAEFLSEESWVKEVYYPGLKVHDGHKVAAGQQKYFGGIVSFRLHDDSFEAAKKFTTSTKLFKLAESLGGIKSLVAHPATMTHASIPKERHADFGITDGLLRLSVGLEDAEDLIADLKQASEKSIHQPVAAQHASYALQTS
ncbi:MAG: PLP-dependent transferase [Cyclobacteriaceae bacterium]|nr:PLP-dependent transferase [Cyclobacteriaceae bacterium]